MSFQRVKYETFTLPKITLLSIVIVYMTLKTTPLDAKTNTKKLLLTKPNIIKSSPIKLQVPGKPILAKLKRRK